MKQYNAIAVGGEQLYFGLGAYQEIAGELKKSGVKKVLIVTDQGIVNSGICDMITDHLDEQDVPFALYANVKNDPSDANIDEGLAVLKENGCNGVIGLGGGSAMDVAKGIKLMATNPGRIFDYDNSPTGGRRFENKGYFMIAVPTTAGTGSEVTPYAIITNEQEHRKATISGKENIPDVAIVDPTFTMKLPAAVTASTGMDALAHAIGAVTSGRVIEAGGSTAVSDALAFKAIELIAQNLRTAYTCPGNLKARKNMMVAATMASMASNAGSDASHGLGHALGAVYHVPHGVACALVMPAVINYNAISCPERFKEVARAMGEQVEGMSVLDAADLAANAVRRLMKDVGIPGLSAFVPDTKDKQFEMLCETAEREKCSKLNPRKITKDIAAKLYLKSM